MPLSAAGMAVGADAVHERAGPLVLRPVLGRDGDHGGVARLVEHRGGDVGDLAVGREPLGELRERLVRAAVGQ